MFASALAFALATTTAAAPSEKNDLSWMTDYAAAVKKGGSEGKPVAVFIGTGTSGWNKLSQEGQLPVEAVQILKQSYVPVYIDARTEEGKALAVAFEVPDGVGIILSDRTGTLQAFRHEGDLPDTRISQYLERFSDPTLVVQTTVSNPSRRSNYGPAGAAPGGYCPTCPTCPNGRCPK
jgi:hypothetical protein